MLLRFQSLFRRVVGTYTAPDPVTLTADDGATILTADDGTTQLTEG